MYLPPPTAHRPPPTAHRPPPIAHYAPPKVDLRKIPTLEIDLGRFTFADATEVTLTDCPLVSGDMSVPLFALLLEEKGEIMHATCDMRQSPLELTCTPE